jgi:membrane protease YdiL (CAAX protease family)
MTDETDLVLQGTPPAARARGWTRREALLLALVLVPTYHSIVPWLWDGSGLGRLIHDRLGLSVAQYSWDGLFLIMPLLLCLAAPTRSGLRLGTWRSRTLKVLGVCALPPILTAIVYPFTSQPFTDGWIGLWLISPAAQDLLFTGYLYGLFDQAFPGSIGRRVPVNKAVLLTAAFFTLWHVPNFWGIAASYVIFQLIYAFVGGAWTLLARQWTGSILPGIVVHMMVNFIAWKGW